MVSANHQHVPDLFLGPMNDLILIDGMFADWAFRAHTIERGPYRLWIANGFMNFRDWKDGHGAPFLCGVSLWARWRIWREYTREVRRRAAAQVRADRDTGLARLLASGEAE